MADVTHSLKAKALLDLAEQSAETHPVELALVQSNLAVARAAREIDQSIRNLTRAVKDVAEPVLIEFDSVWINPAAVEALVAISPEQTEIHLLSGNSFEVMSSVQSVSAKLEH